MLMAANSESPSLPAPVPGGPPALAGRPPELRSDRSGATPGGPSAFGAGRPEPWGESLRQWIVSTIALLATAIGPLELMLGRAGRGGVLCAVAAVGWLWVISSLRRPQANS